MKKRSGKRPARKSSSKIRKGDAQDLIEIMAITRRSAEKIFNQTLKKLTKGIE